MIEVAVTDSHALIWHALGRGRKLGTQARALFERADAGNACIYVPAIVLVEVLEADRRGVLSLGGGAESWVRGLFGSGAYFEAPLTGDIVLRGQALQSIPERGDRLIAATAAHMELPLISRDPAIADAAAVALVW